MKVRSICTTRRAKIVVLLLWIISAAQFIPSFWIVVSLILYHRRLKRQIVTHQIMQGYELTHITLNIEW